MTNTVVFIIYHGTSHFNACFKLAKSLKVDHDVIFAGHNSFRSYIETQGFIFYPLHTVPFGMGFERWVVDQNKLKVPYLQTIKYRWFDTLYKLREAELIQMLHDLEPNCILIDAYQSTDFVVLYPHLKNTYIRIGFIQTMLPTVIQRNYPLINSTILPEDSAGIKRDWRKYKWDYFLKNIKEKLMYFGMNDTSIINRRIRKNRIAAHYLSTEKNLRGINISEVHQFIVAPVEFDFQNTNKNRFHHYVGFQPDLHRIEIADMEYFKVDSEIRRKINDHAGILIYCAFGSVKAGDTSVVNSFLQKLIKAVVDRNCILVISISSIKHESNFTEVPENVYILKFVPQLEVLKRTDVFITHGGLNSIKESIYMNVPMLVYPLHNITDTAGNSSRVIYHQLGLRGDLQNETVDGINEKIIELVNNEKYKINLHALREKDERYQHQFLEHYKSLSTLD